MELRGGKSIFLQWWNSMPSRTQPVLSNHWADRGRQRSESLQDDLQVSGFFSFWKPANTFSFSLILDHLPICPAQDSFFFLSALSKTEWKPWGLAIKSIAHWASPPLASWPISQAWPPENALHTAQPQPTHPPMPRSCPCTGVPSSRHWHVVEC